jgi:hypothetical protein
MRMAHYFAALAALVIPALLWTAWTGFALGGEVHVGWGLFGAVYTAAVHTLLILFMLVTGRVLKEAMAARPLGPEFLSELNQFFAKKKAYPVALLAASVTAAAAVLGFAHRGFGTPTWIHWSAGLAAIALNLWAIPAEYRALRENQGLLDRAARELDRIDREQQAKGGSAVPVVDLEQPFDPAGAARWGLIVAVSAWFPYLYWALIVWRGDFARVSLHPWIEGSILGLAVWLVAAREARAAR